MADLSAWTKARTAALNALKANGPGVAQSLRQAAAEVTSTVATHDTRPAATVWRAYASALNSSARLVEWKNAIRNAEPDSGRHLSSAHLLAAEAKTTLSMADILQAPLGKVLDSIIAVASPTEVAPCVASLRGVPLPLPISEAPPPPPSRMAEKTQTPPEPIAVVLFDLNGEPAPDAAVVRANRFNDLRIQLRLTSWPEWAATLEAGAISVAGDNASFPTFHFSRPEAQDADGLWTVEDQRPLVVKASQPLASAPITFTVLVTFSSHDGRRKRTVRTAGQRELRVWATDNEHELYFSGCAQLDQRLAQLFARLRGNSAFGSEQERRAFMRFLHALLRVTMALQKRGSYSGTSIEETRFQKDLLLLLDQRDELGGRVQEGAKIGGGETDIVHDNIVAELKVERARPVTLENAPQYLGQTTSYSSGLGSQLGIAVVLDLSPKSSPLGSPGNYIHWLQPKLHGVDAPRYPSHVAVLVVNGNLPRPSDFAGRRVGALGGQTLSVTAGDDPSVAKGPSDARD